MPLTYANENDLAGWISDGPEYPGNAARLIRSASQMVRSATRAATYDTEPSGLPEAGSDTADAMRDATCAQVESWLLLSIDPGKGQADDGSKTVAAKSISGATIQYAVYAGAAQARADAATHLCVEAAAILSNAGLTTGRIGVSG